MRQTVSCWSLLTVAGLGIALAEQQLACKGGGNLTEVLCSRSDTSIMCSLLRPPATAAVAPPHWSLQTPQTILVMPDAALDRARHMRLIDATEEAWEAMQRGSRLVQRGGLRLVWVVDSAVDPQKLPEQQELRAWHVDVYGDGHPPLEHVRFSHGPQSKLVAKHGSQTAAVSDSLQVCGSWVLFLDGPLAGTKVRLDQGQELRQEDRTGVLASWGKHFADYSLAWGMFLGAVGVCAVMPLTQGLRQQFQHAGSTSNGISKQHKAPTKTGSGLVGQGASRAVSPQRLSASPSDLQHPQPSLAQPSGQTSPDQQPPGDPWDRHDSPWAPLQPRSPAESKRLRRRCESGPANGQRQHSGLTPSVEDSPDDSASSSQQLPSLDSLLLPPVVDEPELTSRTPLSTRPLRASQNFSASPQGSPTSRNDTSTDGLNKTSNAKSSQELAWEVVNQRLKQWENQSWQLREEDIEICLRPDGSDWRLGTGSYGTVYRGFMHQSTPVAVKIITEQSQKEKLRFVQEISILKNLRHTNIVQFTGALIDPSQIVLATEFMPRGDLWHALRADKQRLFAWSRRGRQVALDIVRGLVYMHSKSVVHLDIKSCNVLLSRDGVAKVADVGLARLLTREGAQVSVQGTFEWAAPEVLMGQPCTDKADIYSLGVVLWEIITGEEARLRALRDIRDHEAPANIASVVDACREIDPKARPTAVEVFELFTGSDTDRPRPPSRSLGRTSLQPANCKPAGTNAAKPGHQDHLRSIDPQRAYSKGLTS